ncbi:NADPH-dependent ferric siderophore reductase [Arthrobacter sp. PGP41]|uniref:siderophore-interacting protein n=1 Tax=Arthrobacter sp. PGP41 TaxID=2079227 RepID=UPI000CDBC750|nr:siderophore-interacting protein [Arthrobacter sp. PGP41]AUZ35661.1 NADPH-dependent ferric siderophore reductase [Arthrobacter sp. PGP41]
MLRTAASTPVSRHPVRVFEAVVAEVRDLGPHFRRITLAGPSLRAFGVPGPTLDLRVKLILPNPGHPLTTPGAPDGTLQAGWYQTWLRQEQPGRGFIRSYTVRALRQAPAGPRIDIDFVLHDGPGAHAGPGSDWARNAVPGQPAWFVGPDASAVTAATPLPEAGINWKPGDAGHVLLAGDETAVPAISSILEALPAHLSGNAYLEVPDATDVQPITTRSRVRIIWLNRDGGAVPHGRRLEQTVGHAVAGNSILRGTYAWVGAEAGTVRNLRRCLAGAGLDARTSEFRGYWSHGKAGSGANGIPLAAT